MLFPTHEILHRIDVVSSGKVFDYNALPFSQSHSLFEHARYAPLDVVKQRCAWRLHPDQRVPTIRCRCQNNWRLLQQGEGIPDCLSAYAGDITAGQ